MSYSNWVTLTLALVCMNFNVNLAQADDMPKRKAGLWEITTSLKGIAQAMPSAQQCIDATTDSAMQQMAQGSVGSTCSKHEIKKSSSGYIVDSVCVIAGSTMTSHGEFTGDFATGYVGHLNTKYDPPKMGRSETEITIQAKYLGACKADQKPGDIIMSNGMKMNIAQLNTAMHTMGQRPK